MMLKVDTAVDQKDESVQVRLMGKKW